MRLKTKASRLESQQAQFKNLLEQGYAQETYKGLNIFTKKDFISKDREGYVLKVFKNTSSHNIGYFSYRNEEQMQQAIQRYKDNHDSGLKYKAEMKEKNKGKPSSHAAAASSIKAELKKHFPHVKFSVTSDSFSMGDSVDVRWIDGCTTSEVDDIIKKYQYGHFDGMTDMYENSNDREDIPQSKYVHSSRTMSKEVSEILTSAAQSYFENDKYNCAPDISSFVRRIFSNCSIPAGAKVIGIERTETDCGLSVPENFYRLKYELPESETDSKPLEKVEVQPGKVQIISYSEKAIAVIGDTYPLKDKLKSLGGKFNKFLSCGAGWIFRKSDLEVIKNALTTNVNV